MKTSAQILSSVVPHLDVFLRDPNLIAMQLVEAGMKEGIKAAAQVSENKVEVLNLLNQIKK